ncbi:MAG: oligosaccharide flippase family protein [Moraxellaceae bacterium]|nr:oligosaccharide flippase family protein [Moraxellaceae bacterium]
MSFASGARITLFSSWAKFAIQLGSFILLSRLLPPRDFGLAAMVSVVIAMATLFADFGLSLAAISARELTARDKSGLFLLNCIAGTLGCVAVVAAGPLLALFYGEPSLTWVAVGLSASLLVSSLGVQFRAQINIDHRFTTLAVHDVVASGIAAAVAIGSALGGLGVWSLVLQTNIQALLITVLAIAGTNWRPREFPPLRELGRFAAFGGHNLATQLLNMASRSADVMALGKMQGADAAGSYARASQLISLVFQQFVSPLSRVILPKLSRSPSDEHFVGVTVQLQRTICYTLTGALSALVAFGQPLLSVALGPNWADAARTLEILSIGAAFAASTYVFYWIFLSRDQIRLSLLAEFPGRTIMIVGAILLAARGFEAVAWTIVAGQALTAVLCYHHARKAFGARTEVMRAALRPGLIWTLAATLAVVCRMQLGSNSWQDLFLGAGTWLLTATCFILLKSVRNDIIGIFRFVKGKA